MISTILLVILILLLVGALPSWPHSRSWGYGPSGGLGLVVLILIVLLLLGYIVLPSALPSASNHADMKALPKGS